MAISKLRIEHIATAIPAGTVLLEADILLPERAQGLVVFAHGSGSSRRSPRNRHVSEILNEGGLGAVLVDLLTPSEEATDRRTGELRFDIPMLGDRVVAIVDWISAQKGLGQLRIGCFGASTGAAAALLAASVRPDLVRAVVSRGGRPDLAGTALRRVKAPSLFIVGGDDPLVLGMNREAIALLPRETEHKVEIVPGATHLFEEPGALDQVAALAREWFRKHLTPGAE
jgi:dienelactone hydrolase